MPHIVVKMYPGSTDEQKNQLTDEITKSVMNIVNKPEAAVSVAIEEVKESEWMEKVYDTEIRPNLEKIVQKTGLLN